MLLFLDVGGLVVFMVFVDGVVVDFGIVVVSVGEKRLVGLLRERFRGKLGVVSGGMVFWLGVLDFGYFWRGVCD